MSEPNLAIAKWQEDKIVVKRPTPGLRWKGGILEQCWVVNTHIGGELVEQSEEWRPVPTEP